MLMLAVIDANILVSALWSRNGSPAKVLSLVLNGKVIPCIDSRIMHEYRAVLSRLKTALSSSTAHRSYPESAEAGVSGETSISSSPAYRQYCSRNVRRLIKYFLKPRRSTKRLSITERPPTSRLRRSITAARLHVIGLLR